MNHLEMDKNSMRLIQINLVLWFIVILSGILYHNLEQYLSVHYSIIISLVIAIPTGYFVNRLYKKYLIRFVKVNGK